MPVELLNIQMLLPAFGLVLARVAGLTLSVPILSNQQMPRAIRAGLVVILSLLSFPIVMPYLPANITLGQAAVGMVGEFIIGEVIGLAGAMALMAAQMAGNIVSHQSGIALGTVFNPVFQEESTVLDQLWFFAVLMFFLALHGHVAVINVLLASFKSVPPLLTNFDGSLSELAIALVNSMFESALRLCGPALVALLLTSVVLGFLTRTMPQLNVLSVGFSFKIIVAFVVIALTIAFSQEIVADDLALSLGMVGNWFQHMSERLIHGG